MRDHYNDRNKDQSNPIHHDKNEEKKITYFSHIKASIFCAIRGHVIFQLALISYIDYNLHYFLLELRNSKQSRVLTEKYFYLKKSAGFSIVRNTIPFLEVAVIMPLIYFGLLKISNVDIPLKGHIHLCCASICIVLMVSICFIARTFELREKLAKSLYKDSSLKEIRNSLKQDDIHYPIYKNGNLEFNFPNQSGYKDKKKTYLGQDFFLLVLLDFITLPLKLVQATTMLSLAFVELAESIFNFPFDLLSCYKDKKSRFTTTKGSLKRSGYLLYGFIRNVINIVFFPIIIGVSSAYLGYEYIDSPFVCMDNAIAKCIGEVKSTCCGGT